MSLIIEPSDLLTFQRPLTSVTKETLLVSNPNAEPVIFKVKTTAPKQYCVRPNAGRIDGNSQVEVQVILQPFKEEPPLDVKCKDKFLVQSAQIQPHEYGSIPVTEIWSRIEKDDQGSIRQHKIKCSFAPGPVQEIIENKDETEAHLPPYTATDTKAPTNDVGSSQEAKEDSPSAHSNNDTTGPALLPEALAEKEEASNVNDPVTETVKEQQPSNLTRSTIDPSVEEQQQQQQPAVTPSPTSQTDKEPQTLISITSPATTQCLREASTVNEEHQPPITPATKAPLAADVTDKEEQKTAESVTTKPNDFKGDDSEKQHLRQELVTAKQQIIRLERELEQSKQDLDGLRLRQNATATTTATPTTGTTPGTRKLPPTVQPLDAVHQHLAQLQKPHSVEGYPPKVVLVMCCVVFLFTYLFL